MSDVNNSGSCGIQDLNEVLHLCTFKTPILRQVIF